MRTLSNYTLLSWALAMTLCSCSMPENTEAAKIQISKAADYVVPISVSGLSGEADSVLKFDLFVLGFDIVDPSKAEYLVTGSSNGHLEARLSDAAKNFIVGKAYGNGSIRQQAHAFAAEIVKHIRGEQEAKFQGKIAFRVRTSAGPEIAVADFDGHNATVVTHDGSLIATPTWISGRFALLYSSWKNGATQIFKHDLSSGERGIFARHPGSCFSPAVSPDGKKVAMVLDQGGTPNLYVCDIDGGNLKQLTAAREEVSSPSWAPDSREIVFSKRSGRASLWKVSIDGGAASRLSASGVFGNLTEADWSPDGKQIAFTCGSGEFSICVVPSTGGEAKILVAGEDPCWAPNSRTIIFTRRANHKRVLSLLDVPTKHVKDCTQNSGDCSQPAWAR
jgi:TolB protein